MAKFWRSYIVQSLLYLLFFLYLYCSVAQCRLGRMLMSSQIVSVFFLFTWLHFVLYYLCWSRDLWTVFDFCKPLGRNFLTTSVMFQVQSCIVMLRRQMVTDGVPHPLEPACVSWIDMVMPDFLEFPRQLKCKELPNKDSGLLTSRILSLACLLSSFMLGYRFAFSPPFVFCFYLTPRYPGWRGTFFVSHLSSAKWLKFVTKDYQCGIWVTGKIVFIRTLSSIIVW